MRLAELDDGSSGQPTSWSPKKATRYPDVRVSYAVPVE